MAALEMLPEHLNLLKSDGKDKHQPCRVCPGMFCHTRLLVTSVGHFGHFGSWTPCGRALRVGFEGPVTVILDPQTQSGFFVELCW